jgi:phage baseplate assembly protein W
MPRAEKFTATTKTVEYFSDVLMNLDKNPVTGLLVKLTNENAIKQSIKNLVLTSLGERFYRPLTGSKTKTVLFDPIDPVTEDLLRTSITNCINLEPRARLVNLQVVGNVENHRYDVAIHFECVNLPGQIFTVSLILKLIR